MPTACLATIPDGTAVFIDAHVFIEHFSAPSVLRSRLFSIEWTMAARYRRVRLRFAELLIQDFIRALHDLSLHWVPIT